METATESIATAGSELLQDVRALLGKDRPLKDLNAGSSVVFVMGPYAFEDLPLDGKRLQSQLNRELRRFFALAHALLYGQPTPVLKRLDRYEKTLREVVEQEHTVSYSTTGKALAAAEGAVREVLTAIDCLHDPAEHSVVLVPDTNALISSPAFQGWSFEGIPQFQILMVPELLRELDDLKTNHRNDAVRSKAQGVINQIKEYRRRGSLAEGVSITSSINLRTVATEPTVRAALPWLDPEVPDDRFLASCVETMRLHPRSVVALVTGDINLQNKAEFAGVPFLEPPATR